MAGCFGWARAFDRREKKGEEIGPKQLVWFAGTFWGDLQDDAAASQGAFQTQADTLIAE